MKDCLATLMAAAIVVVFVAAIVGGCFFLWYVSLPYLPEVQPTPDPLDIYEDAINRCQTRETLSDEECQAAALREAYPIGD